MSHRVYRLLTQHQKLDAALRQELGKLWPDPARAAQLKKMKLAIKDRLHFLSLGRNLQSS